MKYLLVIGLLTLASCSDAVQEKSTVANQMHCTSDLARDSSYVTIVRCENSEVLCYSTQHGIQCKFKSP